MKSISVCYVLYYYKKGNVLHLALISTISLIPVLHEFEVLNDKISLKLAVYAQDIYDANNRAQP